MIRRTIKTASANTAKIVVFNKSRLICATGSSVSLFLVTTFAFAMCVEYHNLTGLVDSLDSIIFSGSRFGL